MNPILRALDALIFGTAHLALVVLFPSVPPQRRAEVRAHADTETPMAWPEMRGLPINEAVLILRGIERMDRELERICEEAR